MRIVIDTNLFVSALWTPTGAPAQLLQFWRDGTFLLVMSDMVLAELSTVLARKRFDQLRIIQPGAIEELLDLLQQKAYSPGEVVDVPAYERDPKDTMFLALALAGKADAIVSGDKDLLVLDSYEGIPILSARAFLELLTHTEDS